MNDNKFILYSFLALFVFMLLLQIAAQIGAHDRRNAILDAYKTCIDAGGDPVDCSKIPTD